VNVANLYYPYLENDTHIYIIFLNDILAKKELLSSSKQNGRLVEHELALRWNCSVLLCCCV